MSKFNDGVFISYNDMSDEQKKDFHRRGGIAVQRKKKEAKQLQEYLRLLLDSETESGNIAGDMCWALVQKALNGDIKAFEAIRSTIGEDKPTKLEVENNVIKVTLDDD